MVFDSLSVVLPVPDMTVHIGMPALFVFGRP